MRLLIALLSLSCTGCVSLSSMSSETRTEEMTWQAVHLADALQTVEIARDTCYIEVDPVTKSLIGDHPSVGGAIVWGVGTAWTHAAITSFLVDEDASPWVLRAWQVVTIGAVADAVRGNYSIGIRIGGANKYPTDNRCYRGR